MAADTDNLVTMPGIVSLTELFMTAPAEVKRTPTEKASILARLTICLAMLQSQQEVCHGNA